MAELTVQKISRTGLSPSLVAAAAAGDTFKNTPGRTFVQVDNGGASPVTVTIENPLKIDGLDVADLTVSVPAGATRYIGPFTGTFHKDTSGTVAITYSAVTSVTVGVFLI